MTNNTSKKPAQKKTANPLIDRLVAKDVKAIRVQTDMRAGLLAKADSCHDHCIVDPHQG
jgi:hypothetical protein